MEIVNEELDNRSNKIPSSFQDNINLEESPRAKISFDKVMRSMVSEVDE